MHALQRRPKEESFVVLLASYDEQVAAELARVLENKQVELLTCNNARDALLAIAEKQIHLIIFDPNITALNGMGILSVIKKFRPHARVVAMGDDLSFEMRQTMVREGVLYQIQTPMPPGQISEVVETVVEKLCHHN